MGGGAGLHLGESQVNAEKNLPIKKSTVCLIFVFNVLSIIAPDPDSSLMFTKNECNCVCCHGHQPLSLAPLNQQ